MGKEREFQFYRVSARDQTGQIINLENVLRSESVFNGNHDDLEVERKAGEYYHEFDEEEQNLKYGRIVRIQEENDFFAKDGNNTVNLSERVQEQYGIGEIKEDITNFGMLVDGNDLIILLEIGFQTPGIAVVTEYIQKILNRHAGDPTEYEATSKWIQEEDTDQKLKSLIDTELKKAEIRMKEFPELEVGDTPEQTAANLQPDNYALRLEWSLQKTDNNKLTLEKIWSKLLGTDQDEVLNTLQQIDYPRLLSTFKVEGFGDEEEEINENLLKTIKFVELEIETEQLADYDEIGQELCSILRDESENLVQNE